MVMTSAGDFRFPAPRVAATLSPRAIDSGTDGDTSWRRTSAQASVIRRSAKNCEKPQLDVLPQDPDARFWHWMSGREGSSTEAAVTPVNQLGGRSPARFPTATGGACG
jgi:hypothetical protein